MAGVARVARAVESAIQASVRSTSAAGNRRSQLLLVSGELAIAQVLLVGAGLLLASFVRLTSLNPGFDPRDLVAVDVSLPGAKYRDAETRIRFHDEVLERLSFDAGRSQRGDGDAGADAAGAGDTRRVDRRTAGAASRRIQPDGVRHRQRTVLRHNRHTTPAGRALTREDNLRSPDVVVINEAFARRYCPGQDPIGKRIAYGVPNNEHYWRTIVGLAADTYEQLGQPARATTYAPFRQALDPFTFGAYLVKTSLPLATVGETVRRAVLGIRSRSADFARSSRRGRHARLDCD